MIHTSVLLKEVIDGLDIHEGEIFLDGTLGNGGHTEEVLKRFGSKVKIFAINVDELLKPHGIEKIDKILLDIGMSSNQLEESGRGFSFRADEPLNMSFKKE